MQITWYLDFGMHSKSQSNDFLFIAQSNDFVIAVISSKECGFVVLQYRGALYLDHSVYVKIRIIFI